MSPALHLLLAFVAVTNGQRSWANLNCPAPRSPENGLSFIFQQGQEVRFKCHPGFLLVGSPVSKCDNNVWDTPVPDCFPEKGEDPNSPKEDPPHILPSTILPDRPLFSWDRPNGSDHVQDGYGQGSRRLPLINGLWRQKPVNRVASLPRNVSHGTPAASPSRANASRDLYSQELSIAETRHRQQQEARDNSVLRGAEAFPRNRDFRQGEIDSEAERRRWRISEARKAPNIQYAGSRSASAYRGETGEDFGDDQASESQGTIFRLEETSGDPLQSNYRQYVPASEYHPGVSDDELMELRQRQIAELLQSKMNTNSFSVRGHNADKAGLIEEARRKQYEDLQLLRTGSRNRRPVLDSVQDRHDLQQVAGDEPILIETGVNQAEVKHFDELRDDIPHQITNSDSLIKDTLDNEESYFNKPSSLDEHTIYKPFDIETISPLGDVSSQEEDRLLRGDMGHSADALLDITTDETYNRAISENHVDDGHQIPLSDIGFGSHRARFSPEKAGQVEMTIRQFMRPRPSILVQPEDRVPQLPSIPIYTSHLLPRSTPKPVINPTRPPYYPNTPYPVRPTRLFPTRAPVLEENGDKAGQAEETMYQQYLQAEHMRRIMDYERGRLEWEQRMNLERRNMLAEEDRQREYERLRIAGEERLREWERLNGLSEDGRRQYLERRGALAEEETDELSATELVQRPAEDVFVTNLTDEDLDYMNRLAVLESIDQEWLSQLSPDLQARYLEEVLSARGKQSDEPEHAGQFLRRYMDNAVTAANETFPSVSTRTSASGHVTTIIESRSHKPENVSRAGDTIQADLSCLQSRSGRRLFIRAPKVPNAYVYRYERKKHEYAPFKQYLAAEFRCRRGFKLVDIEKNFLLCRRMEWVGEKPKCVQTV